jgi:hypothetical protein
LISDTSSLQHSAPSIREGLLATIPAVACHEDLPVLCRHYKETFCFISTFEWCATDRRHKYLLTVCPVNEVGLFLVAFLFPLKPSISKANCAAMLCQSGLTILLVGVVSDRALMSGGLSHQPGEVSPHN